MRLEWSDLALSYVSLHLPGLVLPCFPLIWFASSMSCPVFAIFCLCLEIFYFVLFVASCLLSSSLMRCPIWSCPCASCLAHCILRWLLPLWCVLPSSLHFCLADLHHVLSRQDKSRQDKTRGQRFVLSCAFLAMWLSYLVACVFLLLKTSRLSRVKKHALNEDRDLKYTEKRPDCLYRCLVSPVAHWSLFVCCLLLIGKLSLCLFCLSVWSLSLVVVLSLSFVCLFNFWLFWCLMCCCICRCLWPFRLVFVVLIFVAWLIFWPSLWQEKSEWEKIDCSCVKSQ